jgi:hypothetical protein
MPRGSWVQALLLASLTLAAPIRADVVRLANGNKIEGLVLEEGDAQLVVRTVAGTMRIPKREVASIDRESASRSKLRLARGASQAGDRGQAARLYQQVIDAATQAGEESTAKLARAELAALEASAPAAADVQDGLIPREADAWSGSGDPFAEEEKEALIRELEAAASARPEVLPRLVSELYRRGERRHETGQCRLAASDYARSARWVPEAADKEALGQRERRCRMEVAGRALRRGDGRLSAEAVRPIVGASEQGRLASYYLGRSNELLHQPDEARAAFLAALGDVTVPADRDLATLRELARLASAGVPVDARTPGVAPGWAWLQTEHFSVLVEGKAEAGLGGQLELTRREVIERLGLRRLDDRARIALIVFATQRSYDGSPGATSWSAGHATRLRAQDDVVPTIYLHVEGDAQSRLRHELTHILVGDALDDALLPMWCVEGVAIHAETEASRRLWREQARYLGARGRLRPARDALGQMLLPMTDDAAEIGAFYVNAALLFDVLAARVGVVRTLESARRINAEGPDAALRAAGLSTGGFEADVLEALRSR